MPPVVPDGSIVYTPLAPSVEKAYYRKCIELKRRLNEVEAANDDAKVRRIRLDRSIMKMRLERAFLLEQLSKRMEVDNDGSEGSADEQVTTPPPDRPHRDKKRKLPDEAGAAPSSATRPLEESIRDSPEGSPIQSSRDHGQTTHANGTEADAQRMDINRGDTLVDEPAAIGTTTYDDANESRRPAVGSRSSE